MGHVSHFVTRINPTLVIGIAVGGAFFLAGMQVIAEAIKPPQISITVQIDNKGKVKAYEVIDGNLVPLK